jgi:invasion protein IalB
LSLTGNFARFCQPNLYGTLSLRIEARARRPSISYPWPRLALLAVLAWCSITVAKAEQPSPDDASGLSTFFGAWELYCSDDAAAGLRRCHIEQDDILVVGIRHTDGTGLAAVKVTGDPPMPGSEVTYQVDAGPAASWPLDGDREGGSAAIIAAMLHGQQIEARYLSFDGNPLEFRPDQAGRTARASLEGFAAAYAEMQRRLDAYRGG